MSCVLKCEVERFHVGIINHTLCTGQLLFSCSAVCQKCGAIGVKHAFYTRERRYCSLACARGSVESDMNNQEMLQSPTSSQWPEVRVHILGSRLPFFTFLRRPKTTPLSVALFLDFQDASSMQLQENQQPMYVDPNCSPSTYILQQPQPQIPPPPQQTINESQLPPVYILSQEEPQFPDRRQFSNLVYTYDWSMQLNDSFFMAAPTSCFSHVSCFPFNDGGGEFRDSR